MAAPSGLGQAITTVAVVYPLPHPSPRLMVRAGFFRRGEAYCGLLDFQRAIRDFEGAVELSLPAVDSVLAARLTSAQEALHEQQRLMELQQEVDSQHAKDKAIAEVRGCKCADSADGVARWQEMPSSAACVDPTSWRVFRHQRQIPRSRCGEGGLDSGAR